MAETFEKAIVLNVNDLNERESVVLFLTKNGTLSLFALGLQKPLSKNRFNLQIGSFVEIEYFQARLKNKIGKLKKSTILEDVDTTLYFNSLLVQKLTKIFSLVETKNDILNAYQLTIKKFGFGKNSYILTFFTNKLLKYLGINPNYFSCVFCNTSDNLVEFEFYKGGYICKNHTQVNMDVDKLKSYYHLETDFYKYFENTTPAINKEIYLKLLNFLLDNGVNVNWENINRIPK